VKPELPSCGQPSAQVERAQKAIPSDADLWAAVALLKATADPTRLKILFALSAGELCVTDLARILGVSESAVSHQLRVLRQANLVAGRRLGQRVFYRLADDHVREILADALAHARES